MLTKELALGMLKQANSGTDMLTVTDAIASMMEDMIVADEVVEVIAEDITGGTFPADQADYEAEMFAQQA